ncbi:transcription factor atf21 [Metarhizium album ARSEF 1941]|uniref:Transcription factor atf21 n=1 Tax=Metarhizium album (strain ARSEF 1941) TaxID=1081103 RepID=A0A0B2X6N8_METAS|nr:transcription factor atf21 [Metarhizium album ARSEF 1941]KHO01423.1 transcription factor atf21 [Metarhizium album ARSEF 1941]
MESICTGHQPSSYVFMGAADYPFWEPGEPWEGYLESCNPEHPEFPKHFEGTSPESSFDGAIVWADGCSPSQPCCTHSPVSPTAPSPSSAPEIFAPQRTESRQAQTLEAPAVIQDPSTSTSTGRKRRRPQSPAESTRDVDSRPKRPCVSRSTSFSSSPSALDPKTRERDKEDMYLERSRAASNKFRERKRHEIAQLESEEYTIEDANRQLRSMLDALTSEILSLKMQLLQHTDCNCELIQAYISKEAHHFVKSLQGVATG